MKNVRKLKWQIPGELLAARYNWCQGPVPGRGTAVEKHCTRLSAQGCRNAASAVVLGRSNMCLKLWRGICGTNPVWNVPDSGWKWQLDLNGVPFS